MMPALEFAFNLLVREDNSYFGSIPAGKDFIHFLLSFRAPGIPHNVAVMRFVFGGLYISGLSSRRMRQQDLIPFMGGVDGYEQRA
jgi:hypothetical protein